MTIQPPGQGFIFWPVGTGDSTTIRVDKKVYLQVDLHHMARSEEDDDPAWPVIDELIQILSKLGGKPYLSVFALTHPDLDHCQGFEDLNDRVTISELWMSPRIFREFQEKEKENLCDDAKAFYDEALRRVKAAIDAGGDPGYGHRIRIIGYDELLNKKPFKGFPKDFLMIPGKTITILDGDDCSHVFEAFVHAPFKDDSLRDRNDCSLAFQISLFNGKGSGQALLMGDLSYPIIRRIFDRSKADTLRWNVLLAPHHCSKSVMYWKNEEEEEETLKQDMVRDFANAALSPGYVVSSSEPVPKSNSSGDNPPHAKAKTQYETVVPDKFICTHEHPDKKNPEPVIFEVSETGFSYINSNDESGRSSMHDALKAAGGAVAPSTAVGFGHGTH